MPICIWTSSERENLKEALAVWVVDVKEHDLTRILIWIAKNHVAIGSSFAVKRLLYMKNYYTWQKRVIKIG